MSQQPLINMWISQTAEVMTGSAFHQASAQDTVQLVQVTGKRGWVTGLSKALQLAGCAF